MKGTFFKGVVVGAITSTLVLAGSAAFAATGGNFILGVVNTATSATELNNTDTGTADSGLEVRAASASAPAIRGRHTAGTGTGPGLIGETSSTSAGAIGLFGLVLPAGAGPNSSGVRGRNNATSNNGFGVFGEHNGAGPGVMGQSATGPGVMGLSGATTGANRAVLGRVFSPDAFGGFFENETAGLGTTGVGLAALGRSHDEPDLGIGGDGFDGAIEAAGPNGVEGNSTTPGGYGVSGDGPAVGVRGNATDSSGVGGLFTPGATGTGVQAFGGTIGVGAGGSSTGVSATGGSFGVESTVDASGAVGVRSTAGDSANDAVQGNTANAIGDALQGTTSGSGAFAVFAITSGGGTGVVSSVSGGATGVSVGASTGRAVSASNGSDANPTVAGTNFGTFGTGGSFIGDIGVNVDVNRTFGIGVNAGITGDTDGNGTANDDGNQAGSFTTDDTNSANTLQSSNGGVPSDALTAEAIEAFGFVDVNGSARVTGTLTKGAGSFEIDHPLDPANYYLRHSFVESPDMKNVYDGVVTTNGSGRATVELPDYFGALNKSPRYQLTVIGAGFAQAIISKEIADGERTFEIRTSKPNVKVSWQVTGIRKDAYANAHRIKVVERKTGAGEAGMYVHPELFGHPGASPLGLDLARPTKSNEAAVLRAQAAELALIRSKAAQARKEAAAQPAKVSRPTAQKRSK